MDNLDFEEFLKKIVKADMEELTDSVDRLIADEISKRPRIKLDDGSYYIKNAYDYFKKTPPHYITPKLPSQKPNVKLESYIALKSGNANEFLIENGYIDSLKITKKGEEYLESISWIGDYLIFLDSFDFYEFEEYLDDAFTASAVKFLDVHEDLAIKRNDFRALFDVHTSRALLDIANKDFESGLKEELKLFIVRLNPNADKSQLLFHEGINQVNVLNLNTLMAFCEAEDIKAMFKDAWNSLDYEKIYFDEKSSFDILIRALTATDLDRINKDIEKAYFAEDY